MSDTAQTTAFPPEIEALIGDLAAGTARQLLKDQPAVRNVGSLEVMTAAVLALMVRQENCFIKWVISIHGLMVFLVLLLNPM